MPKNDKAPVTSQFAAPFCPVYSVGLFVYAYFKLMLLNGNTHTFQAFEQNVSLTQAQVNWSIEGRKSGRTGAFPLFVRIQLCEIVPLKICFGLHYLCLS